jgi:putative membrane protein
VEGDDVGVAVAFPAWTPHPDVWLLVGLFAAGYAIAVTRWGPCNAAPGRPAVSRFQVTCWCLGVFAVWLASDWPIHDIAERYNYSVHMVQHLIFAMVAAPLLLLGTPAWLLRKALAPPWLLHAVRALARFVPALIVFNVVLVLTHWPYMVNASLHSGLVHFSLHAVLFVSSLIVWLPIVSPLPEIPRLVPVARMLYLFGWSVLPAIPASFLTFGTTPLYKFYETVPHLFGLSTLADQQLAGLIMKLGAGVLIWSLIAVTFFQWASEEERTSTPRYGLDEMDRELTQMDLRR